MKRVIFESGAFQEFTGWAVQDKKIYAKIVELIRDIDRSPFTGLGKPEPLRHELKGYWSRRGVAGSVKSTTPTAIFSSLINACHNELRFRTCASRSSRPPSSYVDKGRHAPSLIVMGSGGSSARTKFAAKRSGESRARRPATINFMIVRRITRGHRKEAFPSSLPAAG